MQPMYQGQPNSPQTELATAIDEVQTTLEVLNGDVLPYAPNLAVLGAGELAETIRYGSKTGNTLSDVTRGFQGTAQSWQEGTKIARNFTSYDYDALRQNVEEIHSELDNLDLDAANVTLDSPNFTSDNVLGGLEELFQRGVDVKQGLVDRLNAMNVSASTSETIDALLLKIMDISKDANAAVGDVLAGKTFYQGGVKRSGTMVDRGNVNQTLTQQNQEYTIQAGKHGGSGKVRANITNLTPANVKQGVNVGGVVGTHSAGGLDKPPVNSSLLASLQITGSFQPTNPPNYLTDLSPRSSYYNHDGFGYHSYNVEGTGRIVEKYDTSGNLLHSLTLSTTSTSGGIIFADNYMFFRKVRLSPGQIDQYDLNGNLITYYSGISQIKDIIYSEYYGDWIGLYDNGQIRYLNGTVIASIGNYSLYTPSMFITDFAALRVVGDTEARPIYNIMLSVRNDGTWSNINLTNSAWTPSHFYARLFDILHIYMRK